MALFDFGGLLGGGSADPYDLYGDILSERQRAALRARSSDDAWANTANFLAKAAMPTNKKVPLGGLLAGLAGSMRGGPQDEVVATALKGSLTTAQIAKLRQEQAIIAKLAPYIDEATRKALARGGAPAAPTENRNLPSIQTVPSAAPAASPGGGFPPPPPSPLSTDPAAGEYGAWSFPTGARLAPAAPGPAAGLLGPGGPTEGIDALGGGDDIWTALAALSQGGGGGSGAPFDLASMASGQGQGLPDVGQVRVEPLSGEARPAVGDRSDAAWEYYKPIIKRLESGNRNIEQQVVPRGGGYNPSTGTVTPWSSASSPLQMLDSTWQGTARKAGIDITGYPRAMNAPEAVQDEVGKALFKERGLQPWAAYNAPLARETGYTGPMANRGGSGFSGRIEPLGGEATPAGQAGLVPGLGVTPEALALMNAMAKLGGIDSPFGSLLETYYKSPGYLEEKARIEKTAESKVSLEYGPLIKAAETTADMNARLKLEPQLQAAIEKAKNDPKLDFEEKKAIIERLSKEKEQIRAAGLEPVNVTVTFPGDTTPREITITKGQLPDLTSGKGIPALGIPPMSGVKLGKPVERPEDLKQQEIDQKFLEEKRVQAESSRRAIMAANDTRQLIEKGVIAGSYADERTRLLKLGQLLNLTGKDDNDRIRQTEAYIANLGRGMKEGLKGLGPPVSNVDIQIAERIAGGQNLTTQGMLELLKLEEKYHRLALQDYGKLLSSAPKSRYDKSVKEPPTFGAPIADNPDGVAHWWDGKTWRPL